MKQIFWILLMVSIAGSLSGLYSDAFPLGTYSYICDDVWNLTHLDSLCVWMNRIGYNTNIMQTYAGNINSNLYTSMRTNGLDAIVMDKVWNSDPSSANFTHYATYPLSTGCYYKFEAEYSGGDPVDGQDNEDSKFWYGTRSELLSNTEVRRGGHYPAINASNGYVWRLTPPDEEPEDPPSGGTTPPPDVPALPGYAYTDLTYRWLATVKDNTTTPPSYDTCNIRVGKEFRIYNYSSNPADDYLLIKYRVKFIIPPSEDEYLKQRYYHSSLVVMSMTQVGIATSQHHLSIQMVLRLGKCPT